MQKVLDIGKKINAGIELNFSVRKHSYDRQLAYHEIFTRCLWHKLDTDLTHFH